MKKTLSLILALILCLSLCACGVNKYVGTYTDETIGVYRVEDIHFKTTNIMTLNANGTGTLIMKATESVSPSYSAENNYEIKAGDILCQYTLNWEDVDGYLVVDGTGQRYYTPSAGYPGQIIDYSRDKIGAQITMSESYELKGNKLFIAGRDLASFTKVD